jgi:hypothetical protein
MVNSVGIKFWQTYGGKSVFQQTLKTTNIVLVTVMLRELPSCFMVHRQFNLTLFQTDTCFISSSYTKRIILRTTTTAVNYSILCIVIVTETK